MDFNALSSISGKSSMRRKSLLQAFGKSSSSSSTSASNRQSAIPLPNTTSSTAASSSSHSQTHNNSGTTTTTSSNPGSTNTTPSTSTINTFNHNHDENHSLYSPSPESYMNPHNTLNQYHHQQQYQSQNADTMSLSSRITSNTYTISNNQNHTNYGLGISNNSQYGHGYGGHGGHGGQSRSSSSNYNLPLSSTSTSTSKNDKSSKDETGTLRSNSNNEKDEKSKDKSSMKRPEDVFKLVRERIMSWSYLNEWYQGDTFWLNTVRISRSTLENSIGSKQLENRARNFYILGISLSSLFDIPSSLEFLKALIKLLDEWEGFTDTGGTKGVKNLFRGQRNNRKVTAGGSVMSDFATGMDGTESYLLNANIPFIPDFYQTHSTLCSIVRDIYKKLLGMFLPSSSSTSSIPYNSSTNNKYINGFSLLHQSTIIHSAPLENPFHNHLSTPKSPASSIMTTTATFSTYQQQQQQNQTITSPISEGSHLQHGLGGGNGGYFGGTAQPQQYQSQQTYQENGADALQLYIAGELPSDRTLVGDGQKLTPQIVDLISKVDTKLKKQFSILMREGDNLSKKIIDDDIPMILNSLNPGSKTLNFDYNAAIINSGNGWLSNSSSSQQPQPQTPNTSNTSNFNFNTTTSSSYLTGTGGTINGFPNNIIEEDRRERDFGTI
ncbi:uncharacterized protein L201_006344 [Kwoniella dendrophila CBS 6074]|uniref:Uncharacterized protein n=1 Tax=Kwoniella dendrophila CBS 6074 TaxID=1295534 RepID=A0AAX4K3Q8_9TREE